MSSCVSTGDGGNSSCSEPLRNERDGFGSLKAMKLEHECGSKRSRMPLNEPIASISNYASTRIQSLEAIIEAYLGRDHAIDTEAHLLVLIDDRALDRLFALADDVLLEIVDQVIHHGRDCQRSKRE